MTDTKKIIILGTEAKVKEQYAVFINGDMPPEKASEVLAGLSPFSAEQIEAFTRDIKRKDKPAHSIEVSRIAKPPSPVQTRTVHQQSLHRVKATGQGRVIRHRSPPRKELLALAKAEAPSLPNPKAQKVLSPDKKND